MFEKIIRQKTKLCLLLVICLGCFPLVSAKQLSRTVKATLLEKKVQNLSFSGLNLVFYVNITNSSSKPAYLIRYDYRFEVNQTEYLSLHKNVSGTFKIDPKKSTVISLPVKISYENLFQAIEGIEENDKANCYLAGGLTFSDGKKKVERISIAFSGDFPILKEPEIEFHAFEIKDLTIGGADLELKVIFKNKNGFELLVDKLKYKIKLGDISINEGSVSGNKNVDGKGSRVFSFPILFSFFEVGKEVYDILRQRSSMCYFSGEAEVKTAWGRVKIPIDIAEVITFSRVL